MSKFVQIANWTRKAWIAASAVAAAIAGGAGVPTDIKAWAVEVAAVLATFGVVFKVSNAEAPKP